MRAANAMAEAASARATILLKVAVPAKGLHSPMWARAPHRGTASEPIDRSAPR